MAWGLGDKEGEEGQGVKDDVRTSEEKGAEGAGAIHLHKTLET